MSVCKKERCPSVPAECKVLKQNIFPEKFKEIGKFAFVGYLFLSGESRILTISNSVKIVGIQAFCSYKELIYVKISKYLQVLHFFMFADCYNLEIVELANALILIKYYAFSGCHKFQSVNCLNKSRLLPLNIVQNSSFHHTSKNLLITIVIRIVVRESSS